MKKVEPVSSEETKGVQVQKNCKSYGHGKLMTQLERAQALSCLSTKRLN